MLKLLVIWACCQSVIGLLTSYEAYVMLNKDWRKIGPKKKQVDIYFKCSKSLHQFILFLVFMSDLTFSNNFLFILSTKTELTKKPWGNQSHSTWKIDRFIRCSRLYAGNQEIITVCACCALARGLFPANGRLFGRTLLVLSHIRSGDVSMRRCWPTLHRFVVGDDSQI